MSFTIGRNLYAGMMIASVMMAATDVYAGQCLKDSRGVKLDKGNVFRLSDYLCRSEQDGKPAVRVQFQRLIGLAPGAVLKNGSAPWLGALYGKYQVVNNDVLKEYGNLISRFGSAVRRKNGYIVGGEGVVVRLDLRASEQASNEGGGSANAKDGDEVRSFVLPNFPEFALVDETLAILNEPVWPKVLNMYYAVGGPPKSPVDDMTVWRYLTPNDAKNYFRELMRYNALVADRDHGLRTPTPKGLQLLEYLTTDGWPETFLYSYSGMFGDEPCVVLDFKTRQYTFVVDIAVVENVSSQPIQIDQLYGNSRRAGELRLGNPMPSVDGNVALEAEPIKLMSSERVVIPLNLIFASDLDKADQDRELSRASFKKIEASKPGTIYRWQLYSSLRGSNRTKSDTYVVKKTRESFLPPSYPSEANYSFGPAWALKGLIIGGERISFESTARNFINVTAESETGSCPILYAWDEPRGDWVRHGKIIHKAQGRSQQASETIVLDGLVNHFRIVEEELERASIVWVDLTLELADGRTRLLQPERSSTGPDGTTVELYANDEMDIVFALPSDLVATDVVKSRLTVTGYYERYPALLLSGH